jgi:phosphoenolpyruvate carboxylase
MHVLSIPPEFLGLRSLEEIEDKGLFPMIKKLYPTLKQDLEFASRFFSKDCVMMMKDKGLVSENFVKCLMEDVSAAESYFSIEIGPKSNEDKKHEYLSKKIFNKFGHQITNIIEKQSIIRKSIG